jgi:hypothetical protein
MECSHQILPYAAVHFSSTAVIGTVQNGLFYDSMASEIESEHIRPYICCTKLKIDGIDFTQSSHFIYNMVSVKDVLGKRNRNIGN